VDFIKWCDFVLNLCIEVSRTSPTARTIGVDEFQLSQALSATLNIADFRRQPEYHTSTYYVGMLNAISALKDVGLIESNKQSKSHWKLSRAGREYVTDPIALWWNICREKLESEHEQLLQVINRLSPHVAPNHAWLEEVNHEAIVSEVEYSKEQLWPAAQDLEQWGFIAGSFFLGGGMKLLATYKGLVWETRRGFTLESQFIDELVAEWETTSVDFKRELYTDTADQKAEIIKDILSLANTQASGRRWLIIGFDDRTRQYYGPPDLKITQNHLEQIMKPYTSPMVDIRYEVVDYRQGRVGKLEILRDPKKLPYRVAKSLGDRKRIGQDKIFVRHGSQVEEPTAAELEAIQEEGNRARSIS